MTGKEFEMVYTRFMDMRSGGGLKEAPYSHIYIEAPEDEARVIFYNRFGHNPEQVSCTCCGEDYSISESDNLSDGTAYDRGCASAYFYTDTGEEAVKLNRSHIAWNKETRKHTHKGRVVEYRAVERPDMELMKYGAKKQECIDRYKTLEEYFDSGAALVIYDEDIKPDERKGSVPTSGYVWVD